MQNLYIYVDMDGVLANFNREVNAVERFANENGFFKRLQPIRSNVEYVKQLIENGVNICVLSASPNEQADKDKIDWLAKYLPELKNIVIMRCGENKADYVKTDGVNVLFDDYGKNCREWEARGYTAFKVAKYMTIRRLMQRGLKPLASLRCPVR